MDEFIKKVQVALLEKGFKPGPVDGICGPQTRQAVISFQKLAGLEADGLVGHLTMAFLFNQHQFTNTVADQQSEYLSDHFRREEFRCCCQGRYCTGFPAEMNWSLIDKLESVRLSLGTAVIVTSGVRCVIRNREVGGIDNSRHLSGNAVDCYAPGFSVHQLKAAAEKEGLSVILYQAEGFCHLQL
ncbi:D-Ala-D-Ala carboxypeptidase family metallohydrolase [Eubacteriaceae bacterium ES3]|nr:D-Ala-D-Ala carboxypeptidase family metallohydrolase [Eubacteriaceae bacterium ES3]